ncbi:MAG: reverse transcriptase family protein [Candidatus Berkiella sp.]
MNTELTDLKPLVDNSNYNCFAITKNEKSRAIQTPKPSLDAIHTRVADLLYRIAPPEHLHSGVKNRSYISNAKEHLGADNVITMDISSFFSSTLRSHVFDFFSNIMLCSVDVADILSHVLTFEGHIPTGSRVSMPLAYYANRKMFIEMLETAHAHDLKMTIYVDDLTFSGIKLHNSFVQKIEQIAKKYNHTIHPKKTRIYKKHSIKIITGVAIKDFTASPTNKNQKSLRLDLELWLSDSKNRNDVLYNRIAGRMSSLAQVNSDFKAMARKFRATKSSTGYIKYYTSVQS